MNTYDLSKVKKLLIYGKLGAVLKKFGDCKLLSDDSEEAQTTKQVQYILS